MLSPGTFYQLIPTDHDRNLALRLGLLNAARADRGLQKQLLTLSEQDIRFWARLFLWQYNPFDMKKGPFIPRPYQERAIIGGDVEISGHTSYQYGLLESVQDAKTVRWPKSRFIGATWICVAVGVWLALFKENVKGLFMSKDEDTAEDTEDPDSLFWKLQFVLDHLPSWMCRGSGKRKRGVFKFWNGNTITSTANVESAGVGGRATFMFVDEFGQFKKGHEIFSMTKDTARCRVFVGTHKGRGTMLHELCFDPKFIDMREIITHWSMDEEKARGAYRFNEQTHHIEVIDKKFDYQSICAHNTPKSRKCDECARKGFAPFDFVMEAKPAGGPCPGIRSPWYDVETRERSDYDTAMNLDIDPTGSSPTFFDSHRIAVLKSEALPPYFQGELVYDLKKATPIRLERSPTGLLKLWVHPKAEAELPRMRAGAAVDVSSGSGHSPSCLSVFNADTGEKVLQYGNANIYAPDFAVFVAAVLRMIKDPNGNHPLLCWETQGSEVFEQVIIDKLHYGPYFTDRQINLGGTARAKRFRAGVNVSTKAIMTWMEAYRAALYERTITNYDEYALDETLNFVYVGNVVVYKAKNKGRLAEAVESGASVHHGDIVRADALAVKMLKELGYDGPERKSYGIEAIPDQRTSGFREWLSEHSHEEEEVWA